MVLKNLFALFIFLSVAMQTMEVNLGFKLRKIYCIKFRHCLTCHYIFFKQTNFSSLPPLPISLSGMTALTIPCLPSSPHTLCCLWHLSPLLYVFLYLLLHSNLTIKDGKCRERCFKNEGNCPHTFLTQKYNFSKMNYKTAKFYFIFF